MCRCARKILAVGNIMGAYPFESRYVEVLEVCGGYAGCLLKVCRGLVEGMLHVQGMSKMLWMYVEGEVQGEVQGNVISHVGRHVT